MKKRKITSIEDIKKLAMKQVPSSEMIRKDIKRGRGPQLKSGRTRRMTQDELSNMKTKQDFKSGRITKDEYVKRTDKGLKMPALEPSDLMGFNILGSIGKKVGKKVLKKKVKKPISSIEALRNEYRKQLEKKTRKMSRLKNLSDKSYGRAEEMAEKMASNYKKRNFPDNVVPLNKKKRNLFYKNQKSAQEETKKMNKYMDFAERQEQRYHDLIKKTQTLKNKIYLASPPLKTLEHPFDKNVIVDNVIKLNRKKER